MSCVDRSMATEPCELGLDDDGQGSKSVSSIRTDELNLSCRVALNVGGTRFETTVMTLLQSEYFATMFKSRFREASQTAQHEEIFLDRDPVLFAHVLNWMRNPNYIIPCEAWDELDFFQVNHPHKAAMASTVSIADVQKAIQSVVQHARDAQQATVQTATSNSFHGTLTDLVATGQFDHAWCNTQSVYLANKDDHGTATVLPMLSQHGHAPWLTRQLELSPITVEHEDGHSKSSVLVSGVDMVRAMYLVITVPQGFNVGSDRWKVFEEVTLSCSGNNICKMYVYTLRMLDHLVLSAEQRRHRDAEDAQHGRLTFHLPCWFDRNRYGPLHDLEPHMQNATTEGYDRAIHLPSMYYRSMLSIVWQSSILPCTLHVEEIVLGTKERDQMLNHGTFTWMTDWHERRRSIGSIKLGNSVAGLPTFSISCHWNLLMTDILVAVVDKTTNELVPLSRIELLYNNLVRMDVCTSILMLGHSYKTGRTFENGVYWLSNRPGYTNMYRIDDVQVRVTLTTPTLHGHEYELIASAQQINKCKITRAHGVAFQR
jgi:hypothetical protein